jgi:hypothetical protein
MKNIEVIQAFLEGRTKGKGHSLEIRDGVLLDYGWYPMARIHKEPPAGYQKLIDCSRYIEVLPPYNSRTSHTHYRMLLSELSRRHENNIVAYKDPFGALFGYVPRLFVVKNFFFPTSLGLAYWNKNELYWRKTLGEHEITIHWKPLEDPAFFIHGPGYITLDLSWNVSFYLPSLPEDGELQRMYERKLRRMKEAAYLVGKYEDLAEALGLAYEFGRAKGNFPYTSGQLGELRKLAEGIAKIVNSDEELVRCVLGRR